MAFGSAYKLESEHATVELKGFRELAAHLKQLPAKVAQKIDRSITKKMLKPILEQCEANAPVGATGNLANSFKVKTSLRRGNITGTVITYAPHAHLVEFGHKMVTHQGKFTGEKVPEHPFMRPAFESRAGESLRIAEEEVRRVVASLPPAEQGSLK